MRAEMQSLTEWLWREHSYMAVLVAHDIREAARRLIA
jgi:ABC-type nitrate/sulfonate/bicarbonate transport system ATPase subunit